jgi:hypothetical protein
VNRQKNIVPKKDAAADFSDPAVISLHISIAGKNSLLVHHSGHIRPRLVTFGTQL